MAMGATRNPACILLEISASLISGNPWNIFGMNSVSSRELRAM
jgi:hypothetical protein